MKDAQATDRTPVEVEQKAESDPPAENGEGLSELLESVDDHSEGLVEVVGTIGDEVRKTREGHSKDIRHLARWFFGSLGVLVVISAGLVYAEKMTGGSFTFLVGTLVGSIITFVGMMGFTSREA